MAFLFCLWGIVHLYRDLLGGTSRHVHLHPPDKSHAINPQFVFFDGYRVATFFDGTLSGISWHEWRTTGGSDLLFDSADHLACLQRGLVLCFEPRITRPVGQSTRASGMEP